MAHEQEPGARGTRLSTKEFSCVSDSHGRGGPKAIKSETTCLKLLFWPDSARRGRAFSRDAVRCLIYFTCAAPSPVRRSPQPARCPEQAGGCENHADRVKTLAPGGRDKFAQH